MVFLIELTLTTVIKIVKSLASVTVAISTISAHTIFIIITIAFSNGTFVARRTAAVPTIIATSNYIDAERM